MSQHGCVKVPKPGNLKRLVTQVARHEFTVKVLGATHAIFILAYQPFWAKYSVTDLYSLYKSLDATLGKVIGMISEPLNMNSAEQRVFGYFLQLMEASALMN